MNSIQEKQQDLYRWFDKNGTLLYVGISVNAYARAKQHKAHSVWWPQASTMTVEVFPNRASVESAEKTAIKKEKPKYNIVHVEKPVVYRESKDKWNRGDFVIPSPYYTGWRNNLPMQVLKTYEAKPSFLPGRMAQPEVLFKMIHPGTGDFFLFKKSRDMVYGGPKPRVFRTEEAWLDAIAKSSFPEADAIWYQMIEPHSGLIREGDANRAQADKMWKQMQNEYLNGSESDRKWPNVLALPEYGGHVGWYNVAKGRLTK